jgi:hypothetical protein
MKIESANKCENHACKKNYVGCVIVVFALITCIAPYLLTRSWFPVSDSLTAAVGNTIGGITTPIITFLSVILLYFTFKEQLKFNKDQRAINDWSILNAMKCTIEEYARNITIGTIYPKEQSYNVRVYGLENISEACEKTSGTKEKHVMSDEMPKVLDSLFYISDLCILFHTTIQNSRLTEHIKNAFTIIASHHAKYIAEFLQCCIKDKHGHKRINIIPLSSDSIEVDTEIYEDFLDTKEDEIKKYLSKIGNIIAKG